MAANLVRRLLLAQCLKSETAVLGLVLLLLPLGHFYPKTLSVGSANGLNVVAN